MNNFKTTIGIEIHTVINSKSKMFSNSKSCHTDLSNSNVNEVDLGLPGTLPTVNIEVVKQAIILAHLFHMKISNILSFDRKHYFYKDLPKGYQITQYYNTIGKNGYIDISINGKNKKIYIHEIHIEEDTAKQVYLNDKLFLDYNRCGMPLIEIVTDANINSAEEAAIFLTQLKRILNFAEISDAKLEEGSLRADINISVAPYGCEKLGQKVEIKNINSISNVIKAIKYEEQRQIGLLLLGKEVLSETRKFDESLNETIFMRKKTNAINYQYHLEPNILPINIDDCFIKNALSKKYLNVYEIENELKTFNLNPKIIDTLLNDYQLFKIFNIVKNATKDVLQAITWIVVELVGIIKKDNKNISCIDDSKINNIIEMIKLLQTGQINSKQCKTIILEIYKTNNKPQEIIEKFHFKQITDEKELKKILLNLINTNNDIVSQYPKRPERVEKMIIGLVMKQTRGQANPLITTKILKEILRK